MFSCSGPDLCTNFRGPYLFWHLYVHVFISKKFNLKFTFLVVLKTLNTNLNSKVEIQFSTLFFSIFNLKCSTKNCTKSVCPMVICAYGLVWINITKLVDLSTTCTLAQLTIVRLVVRLVGC